MQLTSGRGSKLQLQSSSQTIFNQSDTLTVKHTFRISEVRFLALKFFNENDLLAGISLFEEKRSSDLPQLTLTLSSYATYYAETP